MRPLQRRTRRKKHYTRSLCGRIKNAAVGLVRPHSGICFLIIRAVRKALRQKVDDLTRVDHTIRQWAVKTAAAIWALCSACVLPRLCGFSGSTNQIRNRCMVFSKHGGNLTNAIAPFIERKAFSLLSGHAAASLPVLARHLRWLWRVRRFQCTLLRPARRNVRFAGGIPAQNPRECRK